MTLRLEEFFSYVKERELIRLRRATGRAPPWTRDPILRQFKFTNVRREYDRTTRQLITEFYQPYAGTPGVSSREEILFNAAVFRFFGTIEFARAVSWNAPSEFIVYRIRDIARRRMNDGERVYTGAYIVTSGNRAGPKEQTVCEIYLMDLFRNLTKIVSDLAYSWRTLVERLLTIDGFGSFMSKEVVLDTIYTNFWGGNQPVDWMTWTPVGPGAKRGASRLIGTEGYINRKGRYRPGRLTAAQALEIILEVAAAAPQYVDLTLSPHDIQWNLCEWDKYQRVLLGQGRPRSTFRPSSEPLP